jgi:glycosidase
VDVQTSFAMLRSIENAPGFDTPRSVTLRYASDTRADSVFVAGTFNEWDIAANALTPDATGRCWTVTLRLTPGLYAYKFVVNGGEWLLDPNAPSADDGLGNRNSILILVPEGFERPARLGDGRITASGVVHSASRAYVRRVDAQQIRIVLRTRLGDVRECRLVTCVAPGSGPRKRVGSRQGAEEGCEIEAMSRYDADLLYDYWSASVALPARGSLYYAFQLDDGDGPVTYDATHRLRSGDAVDEWLRLSARDYPNPRPPGWARDAVFYQIVPDRFARGGDGADLASAPQGADPSPWIRKGGDLEGIRARLGYVADLGIDALYFTPVFAARSYHGYDTTDYHRVEPALGSNEDLSRLVSDAHGRGMRVILDGVFNHTGTDFFAFADLRERAAASPYRDWYSVSRFPIEVGRGQRTYQCWFNHPGMPKLNVANQEVRRYLLEAATLWIQQAGIDGWRLDVANEIDHPFWMEFRKAMRATKPDALLVGEIWNNAAAWLQGDELDSAMNYWWRAAVMDFFVTDRIGPSVFDLRLREIREEYPAPATAVMMNMLSSHDTVRLRTLCGGDRARERQAILFQMTYPGMPCVYYGDEIGMEGGPDPDNRRTMIWEESRWDRDLLDFYRRLIALRRASPALRRGEYRTLVADDARGLFAFLRIDAHERVVVAFNRGKRHARLSLDAADVGGGLLRDWLGGAPLLARAGRFTMTVPAGGMMLLGKPPPREILCK